ncbi:hypothetical protein JOF35_008730 [Streptomyces demainii]|uniref:Uncharacterized protein n=1 Tax=Streptomyces demainii TaxID=588122 RepID=A0ABT9L9E0_9ACTN|nr:hypothetical protein [Streptomyces demainii]
MRLRGFRLGGLGLGHGGVLLVGGCGHAIRPACAPRLGRALRASRATHGMSHTG